MATCINLVALERSQSVTKGILKAWPLFRYHTWPRERTGISSLDETEIRKDLQRAIYRICRGEEQELDGGNEM
jgi:hypothetical protein